MYCINCGNKLNHDDNFCVQCGTSVNKSPATNNQKEKTNNTNYSLILGIISCCLFFIPFLSIPLAITTIVIGIANKKTQKLAGVFLGIISIILTIIMIISFIFFAGYITNKIINSDFPEEFKEIIEDEYLEISGSSFIATDNSIIDFYIDGTYNWTLNDTNYNKGTYISYSGLTAYNYAKTNLTNFKAYEYDIDDFYLIITSPTEIVVNGSTINETNTVYYYGEYEEDDKTLELYNHNTGNYLNLTLYLNNKISDIDI